MPQHSHTVATIWPCCVCFYRISSVKSLIMQEQLTPSPFPLTPPDAGAEKKHMMYGEKIERSWPSVSDQSESAFLSRAPAVGGWNRTHAWGHTHLHSLMHLSHCFTQEIFLFGIHFHEVTKQRWIVFHYAETCKPSFSVHLDCSAHGLLTWDGEMLDLFWFLSFVHFRNSETILSFLFSPLASFLFPIEYVSSSKSKSV